MNLQQCRENASGRCDVCDAGLSLDPRDHETYCPRCEPEIGASVEAWEKDGRKPTSVLWRPKD